jgi:hypothetical protein
VPTLPDYPEVLKVRTLFTIGADSSVSTTLHFAYSGPAPTDGVCTALSDDILSFAIAQLPSVLSNQNTIDAVSVQDLTSPTAGYGETTGVTDGTETGAPLPAATCVLASAHIARRYRGGKPRNYWPLGTATDLLNPSAWESASVTAFDTQIAAYINSIVGHSESGTTIGAWVSISYYEGFTAVLNPITGRTRDIPKVRTAAIAPDTVLSMAISPRPATQRRRSQQR